MRKHPYPGLSERLLRGGVSRRHVDRLLEEIAGHHADLLSEYEAAGMSRDDSEARALERLGTEDALAASILSRPELRSWDRKRPWLAYFLMPVLALPLQFVLAMVLSTQIFAWAVTHMGLTATHQGLIPWICNSLALYAVWVAPALVAAAAGYVARSRHAPISWPIAAGLVIALVGAATNAGFEWTPALPHGAISGGIGVPGKGPAQLARVAVTLLAGLLAWHSADAAARTNSPAEH